MIKNSMEISQDDLKNFLFQECYSAEYATTNIHQLINNHHNLQNDLSRIEFSLENNSFFDEDNNIWKSELMGCHKISNFTFYGVVAGGDWEKYAVFFIIYIDLKGKIRAYVPLLGNVYNKISNMAFGNSLEYTSDYNVDDEYAKQNGYENFQLMELQNPRILIHDYDLITQDIIENMHSILNGKSFHDKDKKRNMKNKKFEIQQLMNDLFEG